MKHVNFKTIICCIWLHSVLIHTAERPFPPQEPTEEKFETKFETQRVQAPEEMIRLVAPLYERRKFLGKVIPFKYAFMGYIKNEGFFDTRRLVGLRQDHFVLFSQAPQPDRCGRDAAAKGEFNMLTIETRMRLEIGGPKVFGIPLYGAVEFDFWGFTFRFLGVMRMRHAFLFPLARKIITSWYLLASNNCP